MEGRKESGPVWVRKGMNGLNMYTGAGTLNDRFVFFGFCVALSVSVDLQHGFDDNDRYPPDTCTITIWMFEGFQTYQLHLRLLRTTICPVKSLKKVS